MDDSRRQYTLKDIPAARLFEASMRGDLVVIHKNSGESAGPEIRGYMMQKKNPNSVARVMPDKPCFSVGLDRGGRLIPLNQAEDWYVYEVPPTQLARFRHLSIELREKVRQYHSDNLACSLKEAIDTVVGDSALSLICIHCGYYFTPYTCPCHCGKMEAEEKPEVEYCEICGKELGDGAKAILSRQCDSCRKQEKQRTKDRIAQQILSCNKCGKPLEPGRHLVCKTCAGDTGPQIEDDDDEMIGGLYGERAV